LSAAKTSVQHMRDGFEFLGFRIQWRRKAGTSKWYVYTFIADLCVPKISSTSCDQAIFVDQATNASLSSDAVVLKADRFG
jgi:hypothetical protein